MTIGGEVYLACDGEEELGREWKGPYDPRCPCRLTSRGSDIGLFSSPSAASASEIKESVGWKVVTYCDGKTLHFCPGCWSVSEGRVVTQVQNVSIMKNEKIKDSHSSRFELLTPRVVVLVHDAQDEHWEHAEVVEKPPGWTDAQAKREVRGAMGEVDWVRRGDRLPASMPRVAMTRVVT